MTPDPFPSEPHDCDAELRADPRFDLFTGQPPVFDCSCGRRWVHVADEAEGDFWALDEPPISQQDRENFERSLP